MDTLKAEDPKEWVRRTNNTHSRVTEIINADIICA